jgi:hypothetical protein
MHQLPYCPVEISVPVVVTMPLHDHVVAALQGSGRLSAVSKAGYVARLTALQRLTGHGLKWVLLQPEQTLHVLKRHNCHGGRGLAASTLKSYVSSCLAALKHTEKLRTRPEYRKARRAWVHAFKKLRDQVDAQYRKCASGEALPNRCQGYVPWGDLCRVRDQLPWGSIERLLLELHTHVLGRSREYASVRLFTEVPSKQQRRRHPNYCVLHPSGPAGSYLRLGVFKTSKHVGPVKLPLSPSLHRAIMTSLRQQPRRYLFEQPSKPGQPFSNANSFNHFCNRRFRAVFGRPFTSNSVRHAYANSLNLSNEAQLQQAAKRLQHTSVDSVQRLYVWGALKHGAAPLIMSGLRRGMP